MSLQRRRQRYMLIHVWKTIHGFVPNSANLVFQHSGRLGMRLVPPVFPYRAETWRANQYHSSFGPSAAHLWNRLPATVNSCGSLGQFKSSLGNYLTGFYDRPPVRGYPSLPNDISPQCAVNIRGAELMNSTHFGLPLTLRFPRVVCVRDDKLPEDCTQVSELEAMRTQNKRGVAKVGTHNISPRKRQKVEVKPKVEVKSSGLVNKQFCVLSASESVTKEQAETFIKEHSGELVCTPIHDSTVLCGRQSVSVKNIIKQGKHLVHNIAWIRYCNDKPRPCPPRLILHCPADMRGLVLGGFDEHGDSYTEPVTVDELHQIVGAMTTELPDNSSVTSLKRYPEFGDFWRFALSDMVLWTRERCAMSYTAEMYGAQVTTDSNCPLVTHRLSEELDSDEGVGKIISRRDLLDILKPFISQKLYARFSQRTMNHADTDVGDFYCVDAASGTISRPGKRRKVVGDVRSSELRVSSAIAKLDCYLDCRGLSLQEICTRACLRHVNSVNWCHVPLPITQHVLSTAHEAGTIADTTVKRLIRGSHTSFVTHLKLVRLPDPQQLLDMRLTVLDLTGAVKMSSATEAMVKVVVKLDKLIWLSLSRTGLTANHLQTLVYPSMYMRKGLTKLNDIIC
eukprot:sb/3463042/